MNGGVEGVAEGISIILTTFHRPKTAASGNECDLCTRASSPETGHYTIARRMRLPVNNEWIFLIASVNGMMVQKQTVYTQYLRH